MSAPNAKRPRGEVADRHSDADAPWKSALEGKEGQKNCIHILFAFISYALHTLQSSPYFYYPHNHISAM